jgi:hypothetical protein
VAGNEDDEIGRIFPVDCVAVDEPAFHFVEPKGGAVPPGALTARPPGPDEIFHVSADVPSRLVPGGVDDGYPKFSHYAPMVNTM